MWYLYLPVLSYFPPHSSKSSLVSCLPSSSNGPYIGIPSIATPHIAESIPIKVKQTDDHDVLYNIWRINTWQSELLYNLNGGCCLTWRFSASWHLYARRVVMVVILSVWWGMSLANIQLLKLGYFRTSPFCWEPSIYCYSWGDLFGFMKSVLWPELHWTLLNVKYIRYMRFKSKLSNR